MVVDVYDLKIAVMVGLFIMALVACVLPFLVSKYVKNTVTVFSVMNCLSGGVVLGAALSHMMPSAAQNFVEYFADKDSFLKEYPPRYKRSILVKFNLYLTYFIYPFTPAIAAFGLLLLLTIDRTLLSGEHSHSEVRAHDSHGHKHNKSHNSHKYNQQHNSNHNNNNHNYNTYSTHSSHNSHNSHNYNNNNHQHQRHGSQSYLSPDTPSVTYHHGSQNYQSFSPSLPPLSPSLPPSIPAGGILYTDPSAPLYSPSPAEPLLQQENSPRIDVGFNTDMLNKSISDYNQDKKSAVAKTWVFLLALSVHSILEGLGMGAEETPDSFYSVLFAVLAHKCLEAFALGLSIFYAKFSKTVTFFMIFGYSVATPLGVLAGMITSSLSSDQNLMAGILVSLASGSFLYISVIEILPTELHKPHVMALKLFAMIFGWFAMVILAYFV